MLSILIRHDCCIYKSGLKCIHVIWTTIYNYHLPGPYEEPGTRYTVCWLRSICFLDPFSALIHSLYPGRQTPVTCFPCCRLLVRYGQWEKSSGDQKGQGKEVGYFFPAPSLSGSPRTQQPPEFWYSLGLVTLFCHPSPDGRSTMGMNSFPLLLVPGYLDICAQFP